MRIVDADGLQVTVLPAYPDALLRVDGPFQVSKGRRNLIFRFREKDGLKLIHAGVRKEQTAVTGGRPHRTRADKGVLVLAVTDEKVNERLADLLVRF